MKQNKGNIFKFISLKTHLKSFLHNVFVTKLSDQCDEFVRLESTTLK